MRQPGRVRACPPPPECTRRSGARDRTGAATRRSAVASPPTGHVDAPVRRDGARYDPASHDGCGTRASPAPSGAGPRSTSSRLALLAYVPVPAVVAGPAVAATPSSTCTSTPGRLPRAACRGSGTRTSPPGTVPHQQLGYLFPMGPFFWLADLVGCPTGSRSGSGSARSRSPAALGARWLFRRLGLGRRRRARRRARLHAHAVPARVHRADLGAPPRRGPRCRGSSA